jgi:hypothetical protein
MRAARLFVPFFLACLVAAWGTGVAADKKSATGPLTGTWECMAHGGSSGDMAFTLYLEQSKEVVTGSVSSPMGGADITTGSFKRKFLELQIQTSQGNYVILGKLEKGQLSGTWSHDSGDKGTWEGKKAAAR